MRDLLSKLDAIVSETALQDKADLQAKRKALQDLQMDPTASSDPEIKQAIIQRKADLEREAKAKGFDESFEIDREDLKPAHDKGYGDASNGIDKNPFNPNSPAFKAYREGQMAYKRSFGESFEIGDEFGISFSENHEIATTIVDILEDGIVIELDDTALDMLTNEGLTFLEGELSEGVAGPKKCWKGYRKTGTQPGTGKNAGKRVNDCEKIGEGVDSKEYDDEAGMADNNIETMKRAVQGLDDLIGSGDNLPEWCQEKIAVAKSMLVAVWDYMQSEENVDEAQYQGREVPLGKKMAGDVKKSKVYVKNPQGRVVKVNFGDKKMKIKKSNPARRKSFRARHNCANPGPRHKARYWSCRSW